MINNFENSKLPDHPTRGAKRVVKVAPKNLKCLKFIANQVVDCAARAPISNLGGVVGLKGSRAPKGAIVKVAGMSKQEFSGVSRRNGSLDKAELQKRRTIWFALPNNDQTGDLRTFIDQVGPALKSAATDAGGKAEVVCYADI